MKRLIIGMVFILIVMGTKAQNLDRLSLSSGGLVNNRINVVIGELFVFSLTDKGQSFETGSLSSFSNTGGINIPASVKNINADPIEALCYPNPVVQQLNFSVKNLKNLEVEIRIIDLKGSIILQTRTNSPEQATLNVSGLKPGQYILELSSTENMEIPSVRFIKL